MRDNRSIKAARSDPDLVYLRQRQEGHCRCDGYLPDVGRCLANAKYRPFFDSVARFVAQNEIIMLEDRINTDSFETRHRVRILVALFLREKPERCGFTAFPGFSFIYAGLRDFRHDSEISVMICKNHL